MDLSENGGIDDQAEAWLQSKRQCASSSSHPLNASVHSNRHSSAGVQGVQPPADIERVILLGSETVEALGSRPEEVHRIFLDANRNFAPRRILAVTARSVCKRWKEFVGFLDPMRRTATLVGAFVGDVIKHGLHDALDWAWDKHGPETRRSVWEGVITKAMLKHGTRRQLRWWRERGEQCPFARRSVSLFGSICSLRARPRRPPHELDVKPTLTELLELIESMQPGIWSDMQRDYVSHLHANETDMPWNPSCLEPVHWICMKMNCRDVMNAMGWRTVLRNGDVEALRDLKNYGMPLRSPQIDRLEIKFDRHGITFFEEFVKISRFWDHPPVDGVFFPGIFTKRSRWAKVAEYMLESKYNRIDEIREVLLSRIFEPSEKITSSYVICERLLALAAGPASDDPVQYAQFLLQLEPEGAGFQPGFCLWNQWLGSSLESTLRAVAIRHIEEKHALHKLPDFAMATVSALEEMVGPRIADLEMRVASIICAIASVAVQQFLPHAAACGRIDALQSITDFLDSVNGTNANFYVSVARYAGDVPSTERFSRHVPFRGTNLIRFRSGLVAGCKLAGGGIPDATLAWMAGLHEPGTYGALRIDCSLAVAAIQLHDYRSLRTIASRHINSKNNTFGNVVISAAGWVRCDLYALLSVIRPAVPDIGIQDRELRFIPSRNFCTVLRQEGMVHGSADDGRQWHRIKV